MRIVVASGKGGTGKTTLAVNLASVLAGDASIGLLDCDVEEPNCHLYLKPPFTLSEPVEVMVPSIDRGACTGCGQCARACEFHALLALPGAPFLLPELCHGCGVCSYVCPENAISDTGRKIGLIGSGPACGHRLFFGYGKVDVGEARSTPVIRAVKNLAASVALDHVIIDAPPGVACPAVEAMAGADFAVLVTEPTPFGLHDLELAVQTARKIGVPFGVVINRAGLSHSGVSAFCAAQGVSVLLQIPNDRRIAEACSRGEIFAATNESFAAELRVLWRRLESCALPAEQRELPRGVAR